jgi:hypothetical protein
LVPVDASWPSVASHLIRSARRRLRTPLQPLHSPRVEPHPLLQRRTCSSHEVLTTLARAMRSPTLQNELTSVDVAVRFELLGSRDGILLDLYGPRTARESRGHEVTIAIEPRLAHSFWLGETHEVSLILQGRLVIDGSLDQFLAFLPAVPRISKHYRLLVGEPSFTLPRYAVLRDFGVRACHLDCVNAPPYVRGADQDHQALVAGAILVGLHPICRRLEIDTLLDGVVADANRRRETPSPAPLRMLAILGDLTGAGSGRALSHANRAIQPERT